MFYIAQFLGLIGLIILIISFQKNEKKKLLKYQIFSSLFFSLQYLCLNGITGCLMNLTTLIRNIIFSKYDKKVPIYWLILVITGMIVLSIFSYNGIYSLLPTIAVIIYSIAVWQSNLKITRIVEMISCILFIIYNIKYMAVSGLIATIIEFTAVAISLWRIDIKKKTK